MSQSYEKLLPADMDEREEFIMQAKEYAAQEVQLSKQLEGLYTKTTTDLSKSLGGEIVWRTVNEHGFPVAPLVHLCKGCQFMLNQETQAYVMNPLSELPFCPECVQIIVEDDRHYVRATVRPPKKISLSRILKRKMNFTINGYLANNVLHLNQGCAPPASTPIRITKQSKLPDYPICQTCLSECLSAYLNGHLPDLERVFDFSGSLPVMYENARILYYLHKHNSDGRRI